MTSEDSQSMKNFEAKVRQLFTRFRELKSENTELYAELERQEEEIDDLRTQCQQLERDYKNLTLAKMIEVSDSDLKESKQKISRLVREINKCINILSSGAEGS